MSSYVKKRGKKSKAAKERLLSCVVDRDASGQFITTSHVDDEDIDEGWEGDKETDDEDKYEIILDQNQTTKRGKGCA